MRAPMPQALNVLAESKELSAVHVQVNSDTWLSTLCRKLACDSVLATCTFCTVLHEVVVFQHAACITDT